MHRKTQIEESAAPGYDLTLKLKQSSTKEMETKQ